MEAIIEIKNLVINAGEKTLLSLPELSCKPNQIHSIIGESGSGKSLTLFSILGLLPKALKVSGEIWLNIPQKEPINLLKLKSKDFQLIRGKYIGMVFQEPMSALNPQMTCGRQLMESFLVHNSNKSTARNYIIQKLSDVGLADIAERILESYPHQISGGQRQRVMIAMASMHNPLLILADEPTTALDSFSRNQVMDDFTRIASQMNSAVLWVSHELDLVQKYSHQITVLKRGLCLSQGSNEDVLKNKIHSYVSELLDAVPKPKLEKNESETGVIDIENLSKSFGWGKNKVDALQKISVKLNEGDTLAVIGTSGSGKSTFAKLLVALELPSAGNISLNGKTLPVKPPTGVQMVFQDPYASLNRNHSGLHAIEEIIALKNPKMNNLEIQKKAFSILGDVGFDQRLIHAFPDQMSGGQRQRLCIAKALASDPKVLILDESVAALDPIIQKQILELLVSLQKQKKLVYIFITHNLDVAKSMADKWCYLDRGIPMPIPESWGISNSIN